MFRSFSLVLAALFALCFSSAPREAQAAQQPVAIAPGVLGGGLTGLGVGSIWVASSFLQQGWDTMSPAIAASALGLGIPMLVGSLDADVRYRDEDPDLRRARLARTIVAPLSVIGAVVSTFGIVSLLQIEEDELLPVEPILLTGVGVVGLGTAIGLARSGQRAAGRLGRDPSESRIHHALGIPLLIIGGTLLTTVGPVLMSVPRGRGEAPVAFVAAMSCGVGYTVAGILALVEGPKIQRRAGGRAPAVKVSVAPMVDVVRGMGGLSVQGTF